MFSSKVIHSEDGSHGKYPVKTCCVSADLSGDMLIPSWTVLVYFGLSSLSTHCIGYIMMGRVSCGSVGGVLDS